MSNISVSVSDGLREKMCEFDEVNWSAVARKAFETKVEEIRFLKNIVNKSKLTEKDAKEIGDAINANMAKAFREMKK